MLKRGSPVYLNDGGPTHVIDFAYPDDRNGLTFCGQFATSHQREYLKPPSCIACTAKWLVAEDE